MKLVILWLVMHHLSGDPSAAANRIQILTPTDVLSMNATQCEMRRQELEDLLFAVPKDKLFKGAIVTDQQLVCDSISVAEYTSKNLLPETETRFWEKYFPD